MKRHRLVAAAALLAVAVVSPQAAAQDASPGSVRGDSATSADAGSSLAGRTGPRWTPVRNRKVHRAGVLWHAATLGEELIALATGRDANVQGRVRVLATRDGGAWSRRGTIQLTGAIDDLLADGTTLYAVGWDEGAQAWRSDDAGRSWSTPEDPSPFAGSADGLSALAEDARVVAIARSPTGLLAVGEVVDAETGARRGAAWRSSDGLVWERVTEAAALGPLAAIAADATTAVVAAVPAPTDGSEGGAAPVATSLWWSADGRVWADSGAPVEPGEAIAGVTAVPGLGFLAWGSATAGDAASPRDPRFWSSPDGRAWERWPPDAALAGVDLAAVRSLEGGALTMAVGGRPQGAWSLPLLPDRRGRLDRVVAKPSACVKDVASVRAILVAVGGRCGADQPRGRAWTTPLEP